MKAMRTAIVAVFGPLLAATQVSAHHSFAAQYDESHSVAVTGIISKVIWKNPHVQLMLDVKDDSGNVKTWDLEMGSPSILMRQGWKVDSLKVGDEIVATGYKAKDGMLILNARKITIASH
jgi:Family of unknown function (DUF6152)